MRLPQLSPRLRMVAELVPPGSTVADIGTDHAWLPVYLVQQGICPRVIAADVADGPLENAAKTIARAGLHEQIELRQSDGFSRFAATDAMCWVLAGMGGTLMARLLSAAPWLRTPGTVLVVQPQSRANELLDWLHENNFHIQQELVCRDNHRTYTALRAVYSSSRA
ncbi:MAG: class I SAM-dependent methyltransferase [Oscillospiraceae bacterium]|nr:class I SAM-dependent methyltransferase [Oscillospiraceae bacterium]